MDASPSENRFELPWQIGRLSLTCLNATVVSIFAGWKLAFDGAFAPSIALAAGSILIYRSLRPIAGYAEALLGGLAAGAIAMGVAEFIRGQAGYLFLSIGAFLLLVLGMIVLFNVRRNSELEPYENELYPSAFPIVTLALSTIVFIEGPSWGVLAPLLALAAIPLSSAAVKRGGDKRAILKRLHACSAIGIIPLVTCILWLDSDWPHITVLAVISVWSHVRHLETRLMPDPETTAG
jgi:hypothetical protein